MQRHRGTKQRSEIQRDIGTKAQSRRLLLFFTLCIFDPLSLSSTLCLCHFVPLSLKVIGTRRLRLYLCPPVAAEAGFISATGFHSTIRKR